MFSSLVVIVIVIVLSVVDVILAADVATFTPIKLDFDDSTINRVVIDLSRNGGSGPNTTMFTLFPSEDDGDGITVETAPANLVTLPQAAHELWSETRRTLVFEWNTNVSSTATSGGVRIGIPSHQLEAIEVKGGHTAQVLNGFTNINTLNVEGDGSILRASMMSLMSDTLGLANSRGRMYVETNIPVTGYSSISNGGQTWVETPSFNYIRVGYEGSQLNIKGDIDLRGTYDGSVFGGGELTVTGTITGTIEIGNNSTVNAPSCDNITSRVYGNGDSGNGTCNAGPQIVEVDVCDLSQQSPDFGGAVSASSVLPGYFATIAVVVVVTVVTVATTATLI